MPDQYVERAQDQMDAIERLIKGLPGVSGYVDKELRRDADKRLRMMIAGELEAQKQRLMDVQTRLLTSGGLRWLDDIDGVIQKLQILIDRVKTASYGYAGLFDPVRVKEEELNALHRFDVALATDAGQIENDIDALEVEMESSVDLTPVIAQLTTTVADLNRQFDRRRQAIVSPDLLLDEAYLPDVTTDTSVEE